MFLALAALGSYGGAYLIHRPEAMARALSQALQEKLGLTPAVRIHNWVVVEEKKPIAELALVSRDTEVGHRIESVVLKSRSEFDVRSAFRVKAGFDLRAPEFSLLLDPMLKEAWLDLPAPKVLSLEMIHYEVIADRNGWWNRVTEDEKALAMRSMQADAKLEAIRAGILDECRQRLDAEMQGISLRLGIKVTCRYHSLSDTAHSIPASAL